MSRRVNIFSSLASGCDIDALAFLAATGIVDPTITSAVCTLYSELKSFGIYNKLIAFYPFVGGTGFTHKFNGKNPLDTNAAFRLTFNGGWVHSSNGALPNGINGYAETYLTANTNLLQNSTHVSYYSRSNTASGFKVEMGFLRITGTVCSTAIGILRSAQTFGSVNTVALSTPAPTVVDTRGFYIANRVSSTVQTFDKNGVEIQNSSDASSALPNITVWLGGRNSPDSPGAINYTDRQCAFASIGEGLTSTERVDLNTIILNFQTALGRNV